MKKLYLVIVVAAALSLGCHKNPVTTPDATPAADAAPPAASDGQSSGAPGQPLPPPPPSVVASADNAVSESVVGDVNPYLTSQLRIFIQQTQRMPNSFTEFAHARLDSIPGPPEGKKWVIDRMTQEVKAAAR
jgi:hypothetical protein